MNQTPVTMIGLGPMGQAMARTFLGNGHPVMVWNRTPGKADGLVAEGARRAETPAEALAASDVIVLSLTDYPAMYDILKPVVGTLRDRTLINLSSDTPEKARDAARWAEEHGAVYLAGGVMVTPDMIGTGQGRTFYSGKQQVFERHRKLLETLTPADFLGEDAGLALLYYQGLLGVLFTTWAGAIQAVAMIKSAEVPAVAVEPHVKEMLEAVLVWMQGMGNEVDRRSYDGAANNMRMMAAGAAHVEEAARDAGIDPALPAAVRSIFARTVEQGRGQDGLNAIFEVLKTSQVDRDATF